MSSVCSAAVCDRANEFLQKSEGDMRHKKTVTGWLRLQNCKNWGLDIQVKAYITKVYQSMKISEVKQAEFRT